MYPGLVTGQSPYLGVPSRLGPLTQELPRTNLATLVSNRIVERVRPHIPPETIESILLARRTGTKHFKNATGDSQACVCSDHLATFNQCI